MLGLTSMLTDISSEMVSTVLPLYFMLYLHASPLQFGLVDGIYQGASALVRLFAGVLADRWRRYKEVAAFGYALSALSRLGLLLVGAAPVPLAALVLADRTGKGIRTAPRDALISLSSSPRLLGQAFGVHRTLDTLGSMLGPLIAFAVLSRIAGAFDVVFVTSFALALLGFAALLLFVDPSSAVTLERPQSPPSLSSSLGLLNERRFRALTIAGIALSLFTVSDAFIFLSLQRSAAIPIGLFPLLYTGTSLLFVVLALPMGRLADRVGRERVFLGGYLLLAACVCVLLLPLPEVPRIGLALALLGGYNAATDGVLMALASGVLPPAQRSSGLGLLTSGTSLGLLLSSVLFGALWSAWGMQLALTVSGAGVLLTAAVSALLLRGAPAAALRATNGRWLRHRGCTSCPLSELEHTCPSGRERKPTERRAGRPGSD